MTMKGKKQRMRTLEGTKIKEEKKMKNPIRTLCFILLTLAFGAGAWAQVTPVTPGQHLTRSQVEQLKTQGKKHSRKYARKVEGKAAKGAKKVSPDPVKKNQP
jgi:uncharacterized protein HemX